MYIRHLFVPTLNMAIGIARPIANDTFITLPDIGQQLQV